MIIRRYVVGVVEEGREGRGRREVRWEREQGREVGEGGGEGGGTGRMTQNT